MKNLANETRRKHESSALTRFTNESSGRVYSHSRNLRTKHIAHCQEISIRIVSFSIVPRFTSHSVDVYTHWSEIRVTFQDLTRFAISFNERISRRSFIQAVKFQITSDVCTRIFRVVFTVPSAVFWFAVSSLCLRAGVQINERSRLENTRQRKLAYRGGERGSRASSKKQDKKSSAGLPSRGDTRPAPRLVSGDVRGWQGNYHELIFITSRNGKAGCSSLYKYETT